MSYKSCRSSGCVSLRYRLQGVGFLRLRQGEIRSGVLLYLADVFYNAGSTSRSFLKRHPLQIFVLYAMDIYNYRYIYVV